MKEGWHIINIHIYTRILWAFSPRNNPLLLGLNNSEERKFKYPSIYAIQIRNRTKYGIQNGWRISSSHSTADIHGVCYDCANMISSSNCISSCSILQTLSQRGISIMFHINNFLMFVSSNLKWTEGQGGYPQWMSDSWHFDICFESHHMQSSKTCYVYELLNRRHGRQLASWPCSRNTFNSIN